MALDLFKELAPSILKNKEYISIEEDKNSYNPFIVNRIIAQYLDCILYCNEINFYPNIDKKLHYDYLFHSIKPKNRSFQKWFKYTESDDINTVMQYYNYSSEKAKEALKLLSDDNLNYMREKLQKGGIE